MRHVSFGLAALFILAGCGNHQPDLRGVERDETLLSVSATGQADTKPDEAQFQAGINSWSNSAKDAAAANGKKIEEIVAAVRSLGIPEKDIQTRAVNVQRLDWGDRKGQYQATNVLNVTVRDVAKTGAAVSAATSAGANIVSGPDLRMADPEKAATVAYTDAYKAARNRAEAYAEAAGMTISRVLTIRDSGGMQGNRYLPGATPVAPPPVMMEQAATGNAAGVMAGQTKSAVSIQVDFALVPK